MGSGSRRRGQAQRGDGPFTGGLTNRSPKRRSPSKPCGGPDARRPVGRSRGAVSGGPKIATLIRSERGVRRISRLFLIRSAIRGLKEERSAIDGAQLGRRMAPSRVEPRPHLPRREQPWRGCGARGAGSPDSRIPALGSMRFYGVSARHFSIAGSV